MVRNKLLDEVLWKEGRINPGIYFDEDIYLLEKKQIFESAWVPIGHEDMVPTPKSFVSTYIGEIPVIITRDEKGEIHGLINRCLHRGNKVCLHDRGETPAFTCSYHGWTYSLDGSLVSVPGESELYKFTTDFNKSELGLTEFRVHNFNGLLFATLDENTVAFDKWMDPDARWWLETFVLAKPVGGLRMMPGFIRTRSPGNWKLGTENFSGDNYHVPITHSSAVTAINMLREKGNSTDGLMHSPIPAQMLADDRIMKEVTAGYNSGCPLMLSGVMIDGTLMYERDLAEAERFGPSVVEWLRNRKDLFDRALTEAGVNPKPYGFINGTIFPHIGMMGQMSPMYGRQFVAHVPLGAREHEIWQWTMLENDLPEVLHEVAAERAYKLQSGAGLLQPDDVENFERIEEAMAPDWTWKYPLNYDIRRPDMESECPGLPGRVTSQPSEINQRQFYRFWSECMAADK